MIDCFFVCSLWTIRLQRQPGRAYNGTCVFCGAWCTCSVYRSIPPTVADIRVSGEFTTKVQGYFQVLGGGLPYKRQGCSSEILRRTHKRTKILFCGRGLKFFHP